MLEPYREKRNFDRTPEPAPSERADRRGPLRFVIQRHQARRLHYDLRLECDGVLKSWAVPKGPSLRPGDKRLAVMTEDHPLAYAEFEGTIPPGEYGAGEVERWDHGTFAPEERDQPVWTRREAEAMLRRGLESGKISFTLRGEKLSGSWALVKKKGEEWLLLKQADEHASEREAEDWARPVDPFASFTPPPGAVPAALPSELAPMIPTEVARAFNHDEWMFEPKLDGIRLIAILGGGRCRLLSRNGRDVTDKFPALAQTLVQSVRGQAVLDGEVVLLDTDGRPTFQGLMERFSLSSPASLRAQDQTAPVDYVVFDLLYRDGWDLKGCALSDRRTALEALGDLGARTRLTDVYFRDGELLYEQITQLGLEGMVAKRLSSTYAEGTRSRNWLKVKGYHTDEFLVCGFTEGQGARKGTIGALILGRVENGELRFCGSVGTGFTETMLNEIQARLAPLQTPDSPFPAKIDVKAASTWVEPSLWAEVRFMSWTRDGKLRAPSFLRMRDDLTATLAMPVATAAGSSGVDEADALLEALATDADELQITVGGHPVRFTHLDRVYWPATERGPAVTKRELLRYYARVAEPMLRHLRDRPLALVRHPDGIGGEGFFQKHVAKGLPEFVETVRLWSSHSKRVVEYVLCNSLATLAWFGQYGVLEVHPWYSRVTATPDAVGLSADFTTEDALDDSVLNFPDFLVVDLDPNLPDEAAGWTMAVRVAKETREVLRSLGLRAYLKTSGKTGLHLYVPLERVYDYDVVRSAAETIGRHVMSLMPDDVTMEWTVKRRPQKVFFDHNQNVRGKTLVAAYSPRPVPGAPVSLPIGWHELDEIGPGSITVHNAMDYLAQRPDPWADILTNRQRLLGS